MGVSIVMGVPQKCWTVYFMENPSINGWEQGVPLWLRTPPYNHQGLWTLRTMFFFLVFFEWSDLGYHHHGDGGIAFQAKSMTSIELAVVSNFFTPFHIPGFCWLPTPLTLWGCRCHFSCSLATSLPSLRFVGHEHSKGSLGAEWARKCSNCSLRSWSPGVHQLPAAALADFSGAWNAPFFATLGITKCLQTYSNSLILDQNMMPPA